MQKHIYFAEILKGSILTYVATLCEEEIKIISLGQSVLEIFLIAFIYYHRIIKGAILGNK